MKEAKVIGVIGETGSGKSTFTKYVQSHYSCYGINADQIGHSVIEEKEIKDSLVRKFSMDILEDHHINRKRLGEIVFNDRASLAFLSQLTHPRIRECIIEAIQIKKKEYRIILIDGVALVEANVHELCDYIIYISASKQVRLNRLTAGRGIARERALSMIASQKEAVFYEKYADYTLSLNQDIKAKEKEINQLLQEIL